MCAVFLSFLGPIATLANGWYIGKQIADRNARATVRKEIIFRDLNKLDAQISSLTKRIKMGTPPDDLDLIADFSDACFIARSVSEFSEKVKLDFRECKDLQRLVEDYWQVATSDNIDEISRLAENYKREIERQLTAVMWSVVS